MHPTSPPDSTTRPPEDVPSYDAHPLAPDSPILRPLLAAAKVPVFSIDYGGILIHASEALLTALHRPASGVLGHPLATLLTEQSASALATAMALTATYSPQACTPLTLCFVPANTTEPAPTLRFSLVALAAESGMVFHGIGTTPHPVPEARGRYYELFHHCPTPLCEMDLSPIMSMLRALHARHGAQLAQHLAANPSLHDQLSQGCQVVDVNSAATQLFDMSREAFFSPFPETTATSLRPLFLHVLPLVAQGSPHIAYEGPLHTPKGTQRIVRCEVTLLPPFSPLMQRAVVGLTDITDRARLEAQHTAFHDLVTAMSDTLIDMQWAKDTQGRYLFANRATCETLFRMPPHSVIGKTDRELCPEDATQPQLHTFCNTCTASDVDVLHSRKSGRFLETGTINGQYTVFEVLKSPLYDRNGALIGTVGTGRDITRRQAQQDALHRSEQRLKRTLDATSDIIWRYDVRTGQVFCNGRCRELRGLPPLPRPQDTPCDCLHSIHPEDLPQLLQLLLGGPAHTDDGFTTELRTHHADGTLRWLYCRGRIVERDAHNNPLLVMGASTDITARKEWENDLRLAKDKAEAAARSKAAFLANMSHELRTPLNGILGMLQLLSNTGLHKTQKDFVAIANSSGRSLVSIIDDILEFTRLDAGMPTFIHGPYSPRDAIRTVVDTLNASALDKGIELTATVDDSVPATLLGDAARLRQVLFNLVGNALTFTVNGSVTVHLAALSRRTPQGKLRMLLEVTDTGAGIPASKLPHIFDPFYQVDESLHRHHSGIGLGLGIVRNIIRHAGGGIHVDSLEGAGTHVFCHFDTEDSPLDLPDSKHSTRTLAILVVADQTMAKATALLLETMHQHPTTAHSPSAALAKLQEQRFDCVFIDIEASLFDGLELARHIRKSTCQGAPLLPLVAMMHPGQAGECEDLSASHITACLSKPLARSDIATLLGILTQQHAAQQG